MIKNKIEMKLEQIKNRAAALLLCLLPALFAAAQTNMYTLEQCRTMALEHNARMKNAKNDRAGAEQTRKEAFTRYFPTVSATGAGYNANKGMASLALAPDMGLSLLKNGVVGTVTAVQPLFAGGQIVNGNRLAKVGEAVSRLQLEQAENEVTLTSEQYFWQVVALQEKLKTVQAADTMLQSLCKEVEVAVAAGLVTRNDLLQVQLKRNEMESSRITLENGIAVSKMLLAQYIGIADSTDFVLSADIPADMSSASLSELYRDPSSSLSLTPEYRLLQENLKANRLKHKLEIGKNLPTMGIGAGYVYHDLFDNDRSFGMVFATVSVPLSGWWGGSHAVKRQKLQVRNAENDLTDKSQMLVIRMQKSWRDVTDASRQLDVANKSIEQSAENLRLNKQYYRAGTTKMSDLLQAQTLYRQSRDAYVDAYVSYRIKTVEYLQATGR